jgi:hypothetical protein
VIIYQPSLFAVIEIAEVEGSSVITYIPVDSNKPLHCAGEVTVGREIYTNTLFSPSL